MENLMEFETASLIVRRFTYEDFSELNLLINQKEITNILPDWAMTEEQLRSFLEFVIGSYKRFNKDDVRIILAIEHRKDQRLIGWCGVFPNDKLESADREVAYAVSRDYRNRGYITEAVMGIVSAVFRSSSLEEIVAIVKPFNIASRRVLEKAGFGLTRRVTLSDQAEYDYFVLERRSFAGIKAISPEEIEPYLDLIAEIEHVKLDRSKPNHDRWLRNRIHSYYSRGALFFAYEDRLTEGAVGVVAVLHEAAPDGIEALGARAEVLVIGVGSSCRRKGIGSILLQHAEEIVKSKGAYCLFMMTYAEDYDVISFYGKNGFIPVATLPDVYGPTLEGNVFIRKVLK